MFGSSIRISQVVSTKYSEEPVVIKKAYMFAAELLAHPIILGNNMIAANCIHVSLPDSQGAEQIKREIRYLSDIYPDEEAEFNEMYIAREMGLLQRWAGGHTSASLELLFREGYQNRIELVLKKMNSEENQEKKYFYKAELIVLFAVQKQIMRYASVIEKMLEEIQDEHLKSNYNKMLSACKNIAYGSPNNFFEAVQLIAFTHEFCNVEGNSATSQGTRIDQLLYPFYVADINAGRITREEALELICSLWRIYESYGERCANLTLGGCDQYGNDCSNEMTLICMEASMRVKADVPLLTLRVHPNLNDDVWNTALRLVQSGQGFPAFYNDKIAVRAKINAGITPIDAYDYSTLGCVEITIGGREFSHTEGARINWLKILELMLFGGKCQLTENEWKLEQCIKVEELKTFDQLYNWFKIELKSIIKKVANFIDKAALIYSNYWPTPYLSSISCGCVENGSDITACGTKYYNLSINCVGMANAVDSLEAIEQLVFKDKVISFKELKIALRANFKGYETLRQKLLECPKYGNDIESVDNKMSDLMGFFSKTVNDLKMMGNRGNFQCGFYSVMHHSLLGAKTGASCDGRYAYTSLASSLSPTQGMDKNGPTFVMNSINKVAMDYMGNGGVLDMKFIPAFFEKENHIRAFRYLIETYFDEGGLEVQFNVVDKETLLKAQKYPEKYSNLVVRVSGYSAYFVTLDRELQNEIIMRTDNQVIA